MKPSTVSELAFESFCESNRLVFQRIVEGADPTPDYLLILGDVEIFVEVKQIDEDMNFSDVRQTRSPGSHVRAKIEEARPQLRGASKKGFPTLLLVYNNLDPLQAFGTEQHDFLAGMYGELTMYVSRAAESSTSMVHGRNKAFAKGRNTSFSAVGWLHRDKDSIAVHLYENMYARVPLNYETLPKAIQYNRVESQDENDA